MVIGRTQLLGAPGAVEPGQELDILQQQVPQITARPYAQARKRALQGLAFRGMRRSPLSMAQGGPLSELELGRSGKEAELSYRAIPLAFGAREAGRAREFRAGESALEREFSEKMFERQLAEQKKMQQQSVLNQLLSGFGMAVGGPLAGAGVSALLGGITPGITAGEASTGFLRGRLGMPSPTEQALYNMMFQQFGGGGAGGGANIYGGAGSSPYGPATSPY